MFRRTVVLLSAVLMLVGSIAPHASASLSTGSCVIGLSFSFASDVGVGLTAPSFTFSGSGTCAATLGGDVLATTSIGGSGESILWNCGATVAEGFWDQTFSNGVPAMRGNFLLGVANGAWVFAITAPGFVGSAQMTTLEAVKVAACPLAPFRTISMTGVMEFQDP